MYFKIEEIKRQDETIYKVYSCDNLIDKLFNHWDSYTMDNTRLEDAKNQIRTIKYLTEKQKVISKKIVHREP